MFTKAYKFLIYGWSATVVVSWGLSVLGWSNRYAMRAFVFFSVVALLVWSYNQRDSLKSTVSKSVDNLKKYYKSHKKIVTVVLGIWLIFFFYNLIKALLTPPTAWDSMTYHLPMLKEAEMQGSLWYIPNVPIMRMNISQSNAEILNFLFFSILGNDMLVKMPQLIAAMCIPMILFKIAVKHFSLPRKASLIATLSLLTIPLYWTQAPTTLNDLIFVFVVCLSLLAILEFRSVPDRTNLVLSCLSVFLTIGTKVHGLVIGALFGLIITVIFFRNLKKIKINFLNLLFLIGAFLIVALPNYLISQIYYGTFLAQPSGTAKKLRIGLATVWENAKHFGYMFYRLPPTNNRELGLYLHEFYRADIGHIGLVGIFLPLSLLIFIKDSVIGRRIKRSFLNAQNLIVFGSLLVFLIFFVVVHYPDPWDFRLIMVVPLVFIYFLSIRVSNSTRNIIKQGFAVFLILSVILTGGVLLIFNDQRILKDAVKSIIFEGRRIQIGEVIKDRPSLQQFPDYLDSHPEIGNYKMLYFGTEDDWVYPFYGADWENEIIFIDQTDLDNYLLNDELADADFLLIVKRNRELNSLKNLELIATDSMMDIYKL